MYFALKNAGMPAQTAPASRLAQVMHRRIAQLGSLPGSRIMLAAAALGFDGIDLGYYWDEKKKAKEIKQAKKIAANSNLKLVNYICGNNFGNAIAEKRLPAEIDKVKTALDEAAELGCKHLRVFAGGYDLAPEAKTLISHKPSDPPAAPSDRQPHSGRARPPRRNRR